MNATESLIERLKAATMGFDWADLPDDAAIPAVPLLREAATELEALRSRCERMERALKPFARVAEHDIGHDEADKDIFRVISERCAHAPRLTVGDLRNAARALQQGGKAE